MRKLAWYLTLGAAGGCFPADAAATIHTLTAQLDGGQVAPSVDTPAFGSAIGLFDDTTGELTLHTFAGNLLGLVTSAHIHGLAGPGENAGVLLSFTGGEGGTSYNNIAYGVIPETQRAGIVGELSYVSIRTTRYANGEIRGQIQTMPEPATFGAVGLGFAALIRRSRR